jgi:putative SOS response-associated peptidase YedK
MCAVDRIKTSEDTAFLAEFDLRLDESPIYDQTNFPTDPRPVIRLREGQRVLDDMSWGLVPFWADDEKVGRNAFNARAESLAEGKALFREAFQTRRCLLAGTSYIEYTGEKGHKTPFEFTIDGGALYAYAGLWEYRKAGPGLSCTMITCEPNELASEYHNRMPVVLRREDYDLWLDPDASRDDLLTLLTPFDSGRMLVHPTTVDRTPRRPKQQTLF